VKRVREAAGLVVLTVAVLAEGLGCSGDLGEEGVMRRKDAGVLAGDADWGFMMMF